MIKTLSQSEFIEETNKFSESYKDKFSYEGKQALYEHLADWEDETGEQIELDYIALCCDFTEYVSFEELQESYPDITDFEQLNERTTVIPVDDAMKEEHFIIQNF